MTCQSSYPLNSEKASPFGVCTVYLSCWATAKLPKTASNTAMITNTEDGLLVMALLPVLPVWPCQARRRLRSTLRGGGRDRLRVSRERLGARRRPLDENQDAAFLE